VALGDSFTEGVGDPHPTSPNGLRGWADHVAVALAQNNPDLRYANLAVRGRRMDEILTVITTPHEVKGASMMLAQEVRLGEQLLIEAKVKVAFISEGRARPIPKALRLLMKADQEAGA